MQAETLKKAKAAAFLTRVALCLLLAPAAALVWALQAYPPQDAYWLCFSLVIYIWPIAGILFVISAAFHVRIPKQKTKREARWRAAHGH